MKRIISMALAFVLLTASYGFFYSDGAASAAVIEVKGKTCFYRWTRVRNQADLDKMVKQADGQLDTTEGWHRVMIIWDAGKWVNEFWSWTGVKFVNTGTSYYYVGGPSTKGYGDETEYVGKTVFPNDGIDVTADTFVTAKNFDVPYIKYKNVDNDNGNGNGGKVKRYYIKFSDERNQLYDENTEGKPSSTAKRWLYHQDNLHGGACSSSYFICIEDGPGKDVNAKKYNDHWYYGSYDRYDAPGIVWRGEKAEFFYNCKGSDTTWYHEGSNIWSSTTRNDLHTQYLVYIGSLYEQPCISSNVTYEGGSYNVLRDTMIKSGVTITVTDGATLVLDHINGVIENNGRIVIDGGATVIVNYDTVVTHTEGVVSENGIGQNSFVVKNGELIILENGIIYSPYSIDQNGKYVVSGIEVDSHGTVYNRGVAALATELNINGGQYYNAKGAKTVLGFEFASDVEVKASNVAKMTAHQTPLAGCMKLLGKYVIGFDNAADFSFPYVNEVSLASCSDDSIKGTGLRAPLIYGTSTYTNYKYDGTASFTETSIKQRLNMLNSGLPNE